MEIGEEYLIIYDDKNYKPIKKQGRITEIEHNLFRLDGNTEWLNMNNIIRAKPVGNIGSVDDVGSKEK